MNQRFITFLTVAEAGSFFDAAQQLFVSYQCVSAHVRSLEEEYGVKLVEHRPRFALTAEGQALLETLKKIRALEEGIAAELDGSGPEAKGHVTLGVPSARYTEIVPRIVPPFKKEYPHVELEVAYDYSNLLQNQVERGILDMAIVTQYNPRPQLNASVLLRDTYLFILSDRLLQVCVGSRAQEVDDLYKQNGITLEQMTQFPIVTYPVSSRLRSVMDEYTAQTGLLRPGCFALFEDLCTSDYVLLPAENNAELCITDCDFKLSSDRYEPQQGTITWRYARQARHYEVVNDAITFDDTFDDTFK